VPQASSLIQRTGQSQDASANQTWVISSTGGTTYTIGFDKEFVKKHLFVDPKKPNSGTAATTIVGKMNRYRASSALAEVVPTTLSADVLRFLKLKKLVLSRTTQGSCGVCGEPETQHDLRCSGCLHQHPKPWGSIPCGIGGCTCTTYVKSRGGRTSTPTCAQFASNLYEQDRVAAGKPNPFGGSGGACTGTNTVLLMDKIDLQKFKDVVVAAIQTEEVGGWAMNTKKEGNGVPFDFGALSNVSATIQSGDTWATFSARPRGQGIRVFVKKVAGPIYRVYHYHDIIT
jgi:hypothetical protein